MGDPLYHDEAQRERCWRTPRSRRS